MEKDLEISRITIVRTLSPSGMDIVSVDCSEGLTLLDTLGMLSFATASVISDTNMDDPDEDD